MKKDLPIRVYQERIDGNTIAVIAYCMVVQRGYVRGFGTFVILTVDDMRARQWDWRRAGHDRFIEVLKAEHHGFMPYICAVDDQRALLHV